MNKKINSIIVKSIKRNSLPRALSTVKSVSDVKSKVTKKPGKSVYLLPGLGKHPLNFLESPGLEIPVPIFTISASSDWRVSYAKDANHDVPARAALRTGKDLGDYETECCLYLLASAATSSLNKIHKLAVDQDGLGYFSKELVTEMVLGFEATGHTLTDLVISPKDYEEMLLWGNVHIHKTTRNTTLKLVIKKKIHRISIHQSNRLGLTGSFNITSPLSDYGKLRISEDGTFNNYKVEHPTIYQFSMKGLTRVLAEATNPGETQVYGFDRTVEEALVMNVREEYVAHKEQRQDPPRSEFSGQEQIGFACTDEDAICMGVIDRSYIPYYIQ